MWKGVLNPAQVLPRIDHHGMPQWLYLYSSCISHTPALGSTNPTSTELQVCPGPLMGSRLPRDSLGTEEGRPWSCSLLMSDLVNTWKFTSLENHLTNTHPLGKVMMSRAREVLGLLFKGFLQQSCQVTPLFKSILQSEQAFSPTVHSSWRLLTTKQQCHTTTWLVVLLQHFFAPFSSKFLVSDGSIYTKNTRVYNYKSTNRRGRQCIKKNPNPQATDIDSHQNTGKRSCLLLGSNFQVTWAEFSIVVTQGKKSMRNAQGQVGMGSQQPGIGEGVAAHSRGLEQDDL